MSIRTEPVGSIPRPKYLVDAMQAFTKKQVSETELNALYDEALTDTITRLKKQDHR